MNDENSPSALVIDEPLTPQQIENWRKVLCGMIGPWALLMPVDEIEKFRKRIQEATK